MRRSCYISIVLVFLIGLLHGCGFQLRNVQLSQYADNVIVEGEVHPETRAAIERTLHQEGLTTLGSDASDPILHVRDEVFHQRATLFGRDGRAVEYELTLEVDCVLLITDSAIPERKFSFAASGRYGLDSSIPLASVAERETLESDLRERLAKHLRSFLLNALRTAKYESDSVQAAAIETES